MENVKDELVEQAFGIVRDEYIRLGGDDRTAKGGGLTMMLKAKLKSQFIPSRL